MIEQGIYALLSANAGVAAAAPGGIYPDLLPKGTTATALTYQEIAAVPEGRTFDTSGVQRLRMQFDCWASVDPTAQGFSGRIAASALGVAVIRALDRYAGTLADGTVILDTQQINAGNPGIDQDSRQYRYMVEMYLWFTLPH